MTSWTVFANRKLSFKKIIMAIWEEITAAKGMAALHLSRKLNVQYKTAYVLLQKLRVEKAYKGINWGYWQCAAQNIVDQVWLQVEPPD
ncbi:hypothetical protein [Rhizobium leguminosarum]|uniref:hypothetical protein n=1 Tax=Rhizobium leguminosarum TaxID=384 RepID=UPI001FE09675|nr:hypothetical protein [Rhizobium leguminosarum]